VPAFSCLGQQQRLSTNHLDSALRQFLQKELTNPLLGVDKATRYSSAVIKSNGTTKEEIVITSRAKAGAEAADARSIFWNPTALPSR
jgi:hypothetical protein